MAIRIERIDFAPWGCFENHSLPFSTRPGDVDLIHGRNASGKSTTSRGERSLLYGIDVRTVDSHTFDYADLRIGARLNLDGSSIELSRRKRRVGSLVGQNGETLRDDLLSSALGGLSGDVYASLFQVDNETLVRGGAELLQGQGEVGASLFAAAAGIRSLHEALGNLEADAEQWFNPRGRSTTLHKRLSDLRDADRRLREATLRPARHREMTRALRDDETACEDVTARLRELELEIRSLERKRAVAPLLAAHRALLAELAGLGETPELRDDAAASRVDAEGRIRSGNQALGRAKTTLADLDDQIASIAVDDATLARREEIEAAKDAVAAINKAAGDRRKREGELQEARAAVASAAAKIGIAAAEIEKLRRPIAARRKLDDWIRTGDELRTAFRGAQDRAEQSAREREDARAALAAARPAPDVAPLEAALTAALKAGDIAVQIDELDLASTRARREASDRFARLAPAPSSLDHLHALAAPSREEAAQVAAEIDALEDEAEALAAEFRRLSDDEAELEEERRRLELEGEPPSAEALADARAERDRQWTRLRRDAATRNFGEDECEAFERTLLEVDHLADRRTDHAAQIERAAALEARGLKLTGTRRDLERRQTESRDREGAARAQWDSRWRVTGLEPVDPAAAVTWLDERNEILGLRRTAAEAEERAAQLLARQQTLVDALVHALRGVGQEVAGDVALDVAIARAQSAVSDARSAAKARAAQETTLAGAERAAAAAAADLAASRSAWDEWQKRWPRARAEAGLPESATPDAAQEIARAIDEGLAQLAKVAALQRRIDGIDLDTRNFDASVAALCTELASDLLGLDPTRAARAIAARLVDQDRAKSRLDSLLEQRATQAEEVGVLEDEISAAQADLDELVGLAGASDARELPAVEERATRRRLVAKEIEQTEKRVAEVGDGRFAELAALTDGLDRDTAALELEELCVACEEVRAQRDEIKERIGDRRRELRNAETDVSAVEAAQDVALARAAVQEAAVAHAKAKLAAAAVRRSIERYRAQNQDPLLRRANELFTRFTLGSFVELFVDVDERGAGLLIGRQRDRVLKRVPEMSKGTREQLFLALRIAAIERYVAASGPVPVVFDDVFVESDPPRSERIFEALGELATLTQVIVLTHYEHLIDVGRRALGDRLIVQDLPDSAPTLRHAAAA